MFAPEYAGNYSGATDDSGEYSSLEDQAKRIFDDFQEPVQDQGDHGVLILSDQRQDQNHALQDYQLQLMLLEAQNKKRLHMARQEQDNLGLNAAPGQSGDQQAAVGQGQEREQ